jgi:ATP synthase protein I
MNLTIVGIQFPICIVLGYLWGRWMDGLFGTAPYLMVIFSIFGIIAGFRNLFWIVGEAEKIEAEQARDEQHENHGSSDGSGSGGSDTA